MQLKTIGESTNILSTIQEVLNANSHLGSGFNDTIVIAHKLSEATSQYSTEAVKAAIKQSTLNEEQIKAILTKKGLKGEISDGRCGSRTSDLHFSHPSQPISALPRKKIL